MELVGRFAPSPTGALHLGNLRTALAGWLSARGRGGRWVLRVEDVDRARCRPEWAEVQVRDLAALGLEPDGTVMVQSRRGEVYDAALARLAASGLLYPCACTRKDLARMASAPHEADGVRPYAGRCRGQALGALEGALRFRLPAGTLDWEDRVWGRRRDDPGHLTGDPLLHRRDGCHAYHLAVVVDDGAQAVTEVVRGCDLLGVTATQIRLQEALGLPRPVYAHLGLVTLPDGRRLGKREGALGVQALGLLGVPPGALLGWLGFSLGCLERPEPCTAEDLLPLFDWSRLPEARGNPRPLEALGAWIAGLGSGAPQA